MKKKYTYIYIYECTYESGRAREREVMTRSAFASKYKKSVKAKADRSEPPVGTKEHKYGDMYQGRYGRGRCMPVGPVLGRCARLVICRNCCCVLAPELSFKKLKALY